MPFIKKHFKALALCAAALLLIVSVILAPAARKIDVTMIATEYRLDDPDYAVERTVVISGYDTRNLLGYGKFEGTFAVDDWENAQEGYTVRVEFPLRDRLQNTCLIHPSGYIYTSNDILTLTADRNWNRFAALLQEVNCFPDGSRSGSFDPGTARFLCSGPADRKGALLLAAELTAGTPAQSVFIQ